MRFILNSSFILLFVLCLFACSKPHLEPDSSAVSPGIVKELAKISTLMDSGEFVLSEKAILGCFELYGDSLNDLDKYYLYAFEAEIMYYSALFDQGINSALKARAIAVSRKDSILIGNTENFLGLFYMNKNFPDSAKRHFRNALQMLPADDTTLWVSKRFHVLNNFGELFLSLQSPDSVLYYTKQSMNILQTTHYNRAICLGYWNIGEALIQQNEIRKAQLYLDSGLQISRQFHINDVSLFLNGSMIKAYAKEKNQNKTYNYLNSGLELYALPEINPYAKTVFLESAIDALLLMNDIQKSASLQRDLFKIKNQIRSTEEKLKIDILNKYYENEQKLLLINEEKEFQEIEIKQNRIINLSLAALLVMAVILVILVRRNSIQKEKLQKIAFEIEKEQSKIIQEKKEFKARIDAIEEERNRIAKELHDDIGSSISSISIYANVAAEELSKNSDKTKDLIDKIRKQTTSIAENLSDLIWAIYSRNDTYEHLIQRMKNFSFEILSAKNIETHFQFDYHFHDVVAGLEIRKNVLLFFKEAINNIAKYSNATNVAVTLTEFDNQLVLTIVDNGIGFNMETVQEGNGFTSLRARSKAINGKLEFHSTPNKGTSLKLTFYDSQLKQH